MIFSKKYFLFVLILNWVMSTGFARKLGQFPMLGQRLLVFIAEIIHGRPVLDIYLTPLRPVLDIYLTPMRPLIKE